MVLLIGPMSGSSPMVAYLKLFEFGTGFYSSLNSEPGSILLWIRNRVLFLILIMVGIQIHVLPVLIARFGSSKKFMIKLNFVLFSLLFYIIWLSWQITVWKTTQKILNLTSNLDTRKNFRTARLIISSCYQNQRFISKYWIIFLICLIVIDFFLVFIVNRKRKHFFCSLCWFVSH